MTSPFDKLAKPIGMRSAAPQFPQRRAPVGKKRGGKIKKKLPGYFFGGLFQGSPATSTSNTNTTTNTGIDSFAYNDLRDSILGPTKAMVAGTINNPAELQGYKGPGVVGQNADQLQAAAQVRGNQGNWQPYFNSANSDINRSRGFDPFSSGNPYVQQAGNMTTGSQAASPFVQQASQTFPGAVQDYMSPYTSAVTDNIARLGTRNLMNNILPGVNDTFTGGNAAQFGRERHADITGRAITDANESILGEQAKALEAGYTTAGNLFNSDANRAATLAGTTGSLANTDINTRANLGQTAGNLAGASGNLALNQATAEQGLGTATQTAAGKDAAALQAVGDAAQQNAQQKETFDYQQYMAQHPFTNPWQVMQAGQGLAQGWQLPTTSNTQGQTTSTQTAAQGSPFGQILGGALSAASLAIPGAGGVSALGNLFGKARDGGYMKFGVGGMVPTISQMRKRTMRQPPQQPGMQPTGMPGMPPMAPPNPMMRQPNGQQMSPFARGGSVHPFPHMPRKGVPGDPYYSTSDFADGGHVRRRRRILDDDFKQKLGGGLSMRFDDGGYADSPFLRSSEGLEARMPPRPFGEGRAMSDRTGREARYLGWGPGAVAARMYDSLPPGVQDSVEWLRDQMPDRALGYAMDSLRDAGRSAVEGDPLGVADNAGMGIINAAGAFIPGMRGASVMTPFARALASRMVR